MMADSDSGMVMENKDESPKAPDKKKTKYDVIIIGAGPAGYTAGIYCSRARHDTLILSGILPGGQLVNTTDVENYPGFADAIQGPWLMDQMKAQAENVGTEMIMDHIVDVDLSQRHSKLRVNLEPTTISTF